MPLSDFFGEALSDDTGHLFRVYTQLVFFVVIPLFVFTNFVIGGMKFRATMATLLVLVVVGIGFLSLDVLAVKEFLAGAHSDDDE